MSENPFSRVTAVIEQLSTELCSLFLSVLSNNTKIVFPPVIFRVLTGGLRSGHQFHTPLPQGFL